MAADASNQRLYALDPLSGGAELIGGFKVSGFMAGLAYDAANDRLYGVTTATDLLYRIDRDTGTATPVGPLGVSLMHGLAFDPVNGMLYGTHGPAGESGLLNRLYRIDPLTGEAAVVGEIGFFDDSGGQVFGLAFQPGTNTLFGVLAGGGAKGGLITIDTVTGAGALVGMTERMTGLAFHPEAGTLYGLANALVPGVDPTNFLYTLDPATAKATLVGHPALRNGLGLEFVAEPSCGLLASLAAACWAGICVIRKRLVR